MKFWYQNTHTHVYPNSWWCTPESCTRPAHEPYGRSLMYIIGRPFRVHFLDLSFTNCFFIEYTTHARLSVISVTRSSCILREKNMTKKNYFFFFWDKKTKQNKMERDPSPLSLSYMYSFYFFTRPGGCCLRVQGPSAVIKDARLWLRAQRPRLTAPARRLPFFFLFF